MPKRSKKSLWIVAALSVVAVAVGTVIATGAVNDAGEFEQRIDADCAPLVVLAFRGSGEGNLTPGEFSNAGAPYRYGDTALVTNGWEGPTLTGLFSELSRTVYNDGFRADSIPVIPVGPAAETEEFGYDAVQAVTEVGSLDSALTFSGSNLLFSATRGAEAATQLMHEYVKKSEGCPVAPKFVVAGYSQGAMAARHTAELNPDSVLGVVNIGDPYQMPDGLGVRSGGAGGNGLIRWKADETQRGLLDSYYEREEFKSSICHTGDPICEFSLLESLWKLATGTYGDHLDYYTDAYPAEAEEDARAIARLAYEQQLLAQAAAEAGESVQWCTDSELDDGAVRLTSVSLSFAGVPTLFSVLSQELLSTCGLTIEFDLDGDGVYETLAPDGTVWATFDDAGPHTIGVRVTDPDSGAVVESERTVDVAPARDAVIEVDPTDTGVTVSAPSTVVRGESLDVAVQGGSPVEAVLHPRGAGGGSIPLAASRDAWDSGLLVPASVPAGPYLLMVSVESGGWGATPVTVLDAAPVALEPEPPVTSPPVPRPAPPTPTPVVPPRAADPLPSPAPPVVDPEEPPVDAEEPPVDPEEPPVDPEEPPVDPEEPPVDPEEPPVDPEEPPVDPDPGPRTVDYIGPVSNDPADGILFAGSGFTPGNRVSLQIEGSPTVSTIDPGEEGTFTANIPTPPPGDHVLVVTDGVEELRIPFTVVPLTM